MADVSGRLTHNRRVLKPRRSLRKLAGRWAVAGLVLVVAGHLGFGHYAGARLERELDRFRAARVPIDPADFARPAVADADNAALDLIAAGEILNAPDETMRAFNRLEPALPLDPAELEVISAAVQHGREGFALVDRAMGKPGVSWPRVGGDLIALRSLSWTSDLRGVTTLCHAAALAAHQRGDDAEAVRHVRRIAFIADAVGNEPDMVVQIAADGMRAQAAGAIFQIAPNLRLSGAGGAGRDVVRELITSFAAPATRRAAYLRGLEATRAQTLELVMAYAGGRAELILRGRADWSDRAVCLMLRPFALNDARLLLEHETRMIESMRQSATWPAMRRAFPGVDYPDAVRRRIMLHLPAALFACRYEGPLQRHFRATAAQRLAATALAVRSYAIDHGGARPASLADLVPAYLPAVPVDPLADGGRPLGYRPDPADPLLYSVGDDGVDHGGSARPVSDRHARHVQGDFDSNTQDAVVHLALRPRIQRE